MRFHASNLKKLGVEKKGGWTYRAAGGTAHQNHKETTARDAFGAIAENLGSFMVASDNKPSPVGCQDFLSENRG